MYFFLCGHQQFFLFNSIIIILYILYSYFIYKCQKNHFFSLSFFDLFSFGHFDERNRKNIYMKENINKGILNIENKNTDNKFFRVLSITEIPELNIYNRNENIFFRYETVSGYDGLILKDFAKLYNIEEYKNYGWLQYTRW